MKKGTITLIILSFLLSFTAKSAEITNAFIFPDYQKGKVYFKNAKVVEAHLNYQTILKQMLFKRNGEVLALGLIQSIDSVVISGRTFVNYSGEEFFEKVSLNKEALYVQFNAMLVTTGKEAGYGGYSQVSSTKSISSISSTDGGQTMGMTQLSNNEMIKAKTHYSFWIMKDNKFIKVSSQGQIIKAFSKHKQDIEEYLCTRKVDSESLTDMKALLNYCFSL